MSAGSFPVFIVYGPEHVAHIQSTILPALASQNLGSPVSLNLVNYASSTPLFTPLRNDNLHVQDWSAEKPPERFGFGDGMNYLFSKVQPPDYFLILNPDTIPNGNTLALLLKRFDSDRTGIVEARQWPSEHPKEYDIASGYTPWASGACALINSCMFKQISGFDPVYFLYCEDVDLSWRSWLAGYEVIYAPEASVMHFTGLLHYRSDRYYFEHFFSARNFIAIARKFFGEAGEKKAVNLFGATPYTRAFIEQVMAAYEEIKPQIETIQSPRLPHTMIKITGFNTYHAMQSSKRHRKAAHA